MEQHSSLSDMVELVTILSCAASTFFCLPRNDPLLWSHIQWLPKSTRIDAKLPLIHTSADPYEVWRLTKNSTHYASMEAFCKNCCRLEKSSDIHYLLGIAFMELFQPL
ncbi:hypothetical protein KFK09_013650 [Dendrobium nobile]|uniref:Uncharacterized protein n=1 Tax=Dendrobium nobile TaxID=94219 RepID=A0A8T3B9H2_DENNO|nr:hypothetical protein KFK09_013650 [Dendrobium nobile]